MENVFEISHNAAMKEVLRTAEKVASSTLSVLIVGENGTGKEWLARAIHHLSHHSQDPFYAIDCAALPPEELERELFGYELLTREGVTIQRGAFEEAGEGTLLLKDIGSMSTSVQMKMLRALEYGVIHRIGNDQTIQVHARVIATLGQHADPLLNNGTMQKDMFYRISPILITMPPLRERREDIPLLIEKFLLEMQNHNREVILGLTPEALHLCLEYNWPGNIRHLKNAVEYAVVMCSNQWIKPEDLPNYLQANHAGKGAALR